MNKKLLALAVAGAMAAPLAAQAEVTIYGVAHVSVDALDNDQDDGDGLFVSSNSSRIGFKGSEDLGGGLKAIWQLESRVDLDESGGDFATRNSFVGLAGGFGAVIVGRHDTPFKIIGRKVDLFADQIGDSQNIISFGAEETVGNAGLWDLRPNNVIAYISPSFNGLQAIAAYVTSPQTVAGINLGDEGNDDDNSAYSLNVTYSNGPLFVGAAYEVHNLETIQGALGGAVTEDNESAFRLAASYEFGAFKVTGLYQQIQDSAGIDGADRDTYGIGAAYSFGNNVLKAQWYTADDVDGLSNSGADMWAIGLDHNLSKSTTAYVVYAQTDNDSAASFSVSGGGHGEPNATNVGGGDASGFSIGLIHRF